MGHPKFTVYGYILKKKKSLQDCRLQISGVPKCYLTAGRTNSQDERNKGKEHFGALQASDSPDNFENSSNREK